MHRTRNGIAAVVLVFAGVGLAWYSYPVRVDPQIQQLHDTQQKLIDLPAGSEAREQRVALFHEMREQVGQLTPEQRKEMSAGPPSSFIRQIHKRVSPYFELPPNERVAFLDREIQRMEEMMRDIRPMMAAMAVNSGGAGGNGSGSPFGDMSQESRDSLQRRLLDKTTPIQRAQMAEFLKDVQQRRQELGLPSFPVPSF